MADPRPNRTMFWRVIRRMVFANRGRLVVILVALCAGSTVTAALLNLQLDAKRRVTTDFRAFGANVIIAPKASSVDMTSTQLASARELVERVRAEARPRTAVVPFLYLVAVAQNSNTSARPSAKATRLVVTGTSLTEARMVEGSAFPEVVEFEPEPFSGIEGFCLVGNKAASQLGVKEGDSLRLLWEGQATVVRVLKVFSQGGDADQQVFVDLRVAQKLSQLTDQASLIKINYIGSSEEINHFLGRISAQHSDVDVRPIRQFTEGEARLYGKISGVLTATVVVVLVLTALSVMAAMTNIAAERKNDVGLMKAIGGSVRRVLRIFLAEAALLGLAAGLMGATAGLLLSIALGKTVFGVAARPRLVVYPVSVALTVIVAIFAAYPLRRLANIRPASVFRGEE